MEQKLISAVRAVRVNELFKQVSSVVADGDKTSAFIHDCLENGKVDTLKKYVLVAATVANKKEGKAQNPIQLMSSVDDAVEILKAGYEAATGRVDTYDAASRIVDRITVRAISGVERAIDVGLPVAVDALCDAITVYYPPFAAVKPVIQTLVAKVTPKVKEVVTNGIKALAEASKPIVSKALGKLKTGIQKVSNRLRSLVTA